MRASVMLLINDNLHASRNLLQVGLKAKFHYGSWFEAGSKLVADRFEAKFHYAIWFEPGSNQLRTSSEPAPNQLRTTFEPAPNQIAYWNLAANLLARASSLLAS